MPYAPGTLVAFRKECRNYSNQLQFYAPNPLASRYENIPNTNYGPHCLKPFMVLTRQDELLYLVPVTHRKPKHENNRMYGDIHPVLDHRSEWRDCLAVNNMIPVPAGFVLPLTWENLPKCKDYAASDCCWEEQGEDYLRLPAPESLQKVLPDVQNRAMVLYREVRKGTPWARKRCPDFPACEAYCHRIIQHPEQFPYRMSSHPSDSSRKSRRERVR